MESGFSRPLTLLLLLLSATLALSNKDNVFLRCYRDPGCRHREDPTESNAESSSIIEHPKPCLVNEVGDFGSNKGHIVTIRYPYQVETRRNPDTTLMHNSLIIVIEREVGNALLPSLFPEQCAVSVGTRRRRQILPVVYGLSSFPPDIVVRGACVGTESSQCFVVEGLATVFVQEGANVDDVREKTTAVIKRDMDLGLFNGTHDDIVGVSFRSETTVQTTSDDDELDYDWLWIFLGCFAFLGFSCCFFCKALPKAHCCKRRFLPDSDSIVYSDNYVDFVPSQLSSKQGQAHHSLSLDLYNLSSSLQSTELVVILEEDEEEEEGEVKVDTAVPA